MIVPAIQFGELPVVRHRMRRVVSRVKQGDSFLEAMTEPGMIDVSAQPGMMMMGGATLDGVENFHCFLPWMPLWQSVLDSKLASPVLDAIFHDSLTVPWGVLGLLSFENQRWVEPHDRLEPFLDAVVAQWDELTSIGARYFVGMTGEDLGSVPSNLHYVLTRLGVSEAVFKRELPRGGVHAVLKYVRFPS